MSLTATLAPPERPVADAPYDSISDLDFPTPDLQPVSEPKAKTRRAAFRFEAEAPRKRHSNLTHSKGSWPFAFPILIVFVFMLLIPLVQSIWYSFTDRNTFTGSANFVGLDNYVRIFNEPAMIQGITFTLIFTIATTILITVLSIPLALVLNKKFAGRAFVRTAFFFPAVPSAAVLGLVWGFILNPLSSGAFNQVLGWLGAGPIPWLANPSWARISIILVALWGATGWHSILYLSFLQSIPKEYYEAASVDGATGWKAFRHITLPLLTPCIAISTLLLVTGGLRVFDMPFTLTGGGPGFATRTITHSLIQSGIQRGEIGAASALGVIFFLVTGVILFIQLVVNKRLEARNS